MGLLERIASLLVGRTEREIVEGLRHEIRRQIVLGYHFFTAPVESKPTSNLFKKPTPSHHKLSAI